MVKVCVRNEDFRIRIEEGGVLVLRNEVDLAESLEIYRQVQEQLKLLS